MRKRKRRGERRERGRNSMRKLCFLLIIITSLISGNVSAFDKKETHPKLTDEAIKSSKLKVFLTDNLNFPQGTDTIVDGLPIMEWLKKGSTLEDEPGCRASNHFHDPLRPWTDSYMSDQPWWLNSYCSFGEYPKENIRSAVHWASGTEQSTGSDEITILMSKQSQLLIMFTLAKMRKDCGRSRNID